MLLEHHRYKDSRPGSSPADYVTRAYDDFLDDGSPEEFDPKSLAAALLTGGTVLVR